MFNIYNSNQTNRKIHFDSRKMNHDQAYLVIKMDLIEISLILTQHLFYHGY